MKRHTKYSNKVAIQKHVFLMSAAIHTSKCNKRIYITTGAIATSGALPIFYGELSTLQLIQNILYIFRKKTFGWH